MVQIQELKKELKGIAEQISAKKVTRNSLKSEKVALTGKIKHAKQQVKDTKAADGDVGALKEELKGLKEQKKTKVGEITGVKVAIAELRLKKLALRNKIKTIKTKD